MCYICGLPVRRSANAAIGHANEPVRNVNTMSTAKNKSTVYSHHWISGMDLLKKATCKSAFVLC